MHHRRKPKHSASRTAQVLPGRFMDARAIQGKSAYACASIASVQQAAPRGVAT